MRFETMVLMISDGDLRACDPGLGDEAFDAPPGKVKYVLYVRKGDKAISISTYLANMKPRLTVAQLEALARTILSRW